jgi:hypothetical protein
MANSNSTDPTPGTIICNYRQQRKDDSDAAASDLAAAASTIQGLELVRGYKLCTLSETEKTYDYYRDIDNYELYDAQQSAVIIKANIDIYAKADGDLKKLMTDDSKALKDLQDKLLDANNEACIMRNKLRQYLQFPDDKIPAQVQEISDAARALSENSQKAADAMVTIAGIHTFADLSALKPDADSLLQLLKDTKTTTDGFIKTAGDDAKAAQTDLSKVINDLNTAEFKSFEACNKMNGFTTVVDFICKGTCQPIDVVETICNDMTSGSKKEPDPKQGKYTKDDRN